MKLGPLEVVCDAPRWVIVQGCHLLGLEKPEDVRWLRWRKPCRCSCGRQVFKLSDFTFTLKDGTEEEYSISQCQGPCFTVWWAEPKK